MIEFATQNIAEGGARLTIDGTLLIYDAEEIKRRLIDTLHSGQLLELDLSHVNEIDTAGVQLLMLVKQESLRQEKTLRIVAHSPAVQEVIEFYNLAAFFGDPLVIPARDREQEHG
ncbi:lipid asymmetry maintenance protein MlaB [Denitratisoma sp. DHT3]|uniref:STAS domain-containing protein n=1 Tax=Denitratisoma sp. DHT3 TaxID=1981880 RepID=UPI001C988534|nr:STAS domain-containing protein [Denitratisoma sp. DHT3]